MDITSYVSGVTANITNQTSPKSIPASVVGNALTSLATLTKTNVESGSTLYLPISSGSTILSIQTGLTATQSGLTATQNSISGVTTTVAQLNSTFVSADGFTVSDSNGNVGMKLDNSGLLSVSKAYLVAAGVTFDSNDQPFAVKDPNGNILFYFDKYGTLNVKSIQTQKIYNTSAVSNLPKQIITASPSTIYGICNDRNINANRSTAVYIDHFVNAPTDASIVFANTNSEKVIFNQKIDMTTVTPVYNRGVNIDSESQVLSVIGNNVLNSDPFTITYKSSLFSALKNKPNIDLMQIGDSITDGAGTNMVSYAFAKYFLENDKLGLSDAASFPTINLLGTKAAHAIPLNGITVSGFGEGRPSWKLTDYLYKTDLRKPSQGTWDLMGLGNGTGTDFLGTTAQTQTLALQAEGALTPINTSAFISYMQATYPAAGITNYATAAAYASSLLANPINPFFDSGSTGIKFNISAYLSRYKTISDSDGSRLVTGSTAGSLVTNATSYNVKTPSHIIIQLGTNDSVTPFLVQTEMQKLVTHLQTAISGCKVILSLPDWSGTYFPNNYPAYNPDLIPDRMNWVTMVKGLQALENQTNKIYYLPSFFVAPTAEGATFRNAPLPYDGSDYIVETTVKVANSAGSIHPGINSHGAWGYQIYSLLAYDLLQ